ncbi:serine hydrolase [Cellulomonas triticagri]|nr:serine hydrolase [Cellulomonas triticagri]
MLSDAHPTSPLRTGRRRGPRVAAAAAAVLLAVTACSSGTPSAPTSPTDSASTRAAVTLPDTPVGDTARWVLRVLAASEAPPVAELERRFAPSFLEQIPVSDLAAVLVQVQEQGSYTPVAVAPPDATTALEMTLATEGGEFVAVQIGLDADGLVETLFFGPGVDPDRPVPSSWPEVEERLGEIDARSSLLVARVGDDGRCTPVDGAPRGRDPDAVLPLASTIKLYVLGAVVEAVEAGDLAWDDTLTLTDDVRSLPSGTLQDEPTGTTVTVREAAAQMIAISDNTATDLLVAAVGREAVEAVQATMGHHDPALNTPLLTTRDLFRVGWGDPALRTAWADGDAAERRVLLDGLPGGVLDVDPAAVVTPAWQDDADWFATAGDLCAAHAWLQEAATTPAGEPVRDVLSANPGFDVDTAAWPYVAFKGGSAPGVMTGTWLAEDAAGDTVVVVVQLAADDPAAVAQPVTMVDVAAGALAVVAGS